MKFWGQEEFIALKIETFSTEATAFFLHNCLRQNSAAGLIEFIDGMADVEVWEEGKP